MNMAKSKYVFFFSWQMDSPKCENYSYLNNVLSESAKELSKKLEKEIVISTDSRDEDGGDSIDVAVLRKISLCDYFVADITSVRDIEIKNEEGKVIKKKLIPNPNVMYELGYAVSTLGWNRVILIWNDKYGNKDFAPFDIRNHISLSYYRDKDDKTKNKGLSITGLLEEKIINYDALVLQSMQSEGRKHDVRKFFETEQIASERTLLDAIERAVVGRGYYAYESTYWDQLIYRYKQNPQSHFVDAELDAAYSKFIDHLELLQNYTLMYFSEVEFNSPREYNDRLFKQRDSYSIYAEREKAFQDEMMIDKVFRELYPVLMESYNNYRRLVQLKLHT